MAAPAPVTRVEPPEPPLVRGHSTLVTIGNDPDACYWEKTATGPGIEGGDMIDTKTMWAVKWRQKAARALQEMMPLEFTAAYHPSIYDLLHTVLINVECVITKLFSNGDTLAAYGALTTFEADEDNEEDQPIANGTIGWTSTDPDTGEEEDPVYTPAGTGTP